MRETTRRGRIKYLLAMVGGVLAAGAVAAPQAVAAPAAPAAAPAGCIGNSFSYDRALGPGEAICNAGYLVRMQRNGDLVLREISTGRACWASGTRAPGDASARFQDDSNGHPFVVISSESRGSLRVLEASKVGDAMEINANVNENGEFYAGLIRVAGC